MTEKHAMVTDNPTQLDVKYNDYSRALAALLATTSVFPQSYTHRAIRDQTEITGSK